MICALPQSLVCASPSCRIVLLAGSSWILRPVTLDVVGVGRVDVGGNPHRLAHTVGASPEETQGHTRKPLFNFGLIALWAMGHQRGEVEAVDAL